ncbi:MAG: ABC transporter ATP-binding protein [Gaiellaceae bacterium]
MAHEPVAHRTAGAEDEVDDAVRNSGLRQRLDERRPAQLLERAGLRGFEGKYPYELSGGMRQRVAICRGLIHSPPLLLMDEPFGSLDALTREQMSLDLLRIHHGSRSTVIFITHSIPEAVLLSDRIALMSPRPGRIVEMIPIDLPKPRTGSMAERADYAEHVRYIRHRFVEEGVLQE